MLVRDALVGLQVEPALAADGAWPRIPGDVERLERSAAGVDQILLQGPEAERVAHRIRAVRPASADGLDEVAAVLATKQPGIDAVEVHARIGEVAVDGIGGGGLHRAVVMGATPSVVLLRVAGGAGTSVRVLRRAGRSVLRRGLGRADRWPQARCPHDMRNRAARVARTTGRGCLHAVHGVASLAISRNREFARFARTLRV